MGWIPLIAGVLGFAAGFLKFWHVSNDPVLGVYLAVAVLAGLDAIVGGARSVQEGRFETKIFVSGFVMTVIVAVALSAFGYQIGVPIWLATVIVFVTRILQNVSYIRRYWLEHETIVMPHLPSLTRHGKNRPRTAVSIEPERPAQAPPTTATNS